ncbi:MAG: hypothetical protein JST55_16420 [Bacteroidetes bacterium]|nr:hypothetical protein [Bacteroidota bacterium]
MNKKEIFDSSLIIRDELKLKNDFEVNPIDTTLLPIPPFSLSDDIKLIILGQDPTVKIPESRLKIKHTLNLDKGGSLRKYINDICIALEISFENVYATNVFKYFYTIPPERTMNVIYSHLDKNLELLERELSNYPDVPIVTLGLPVLRLLTKENSEVSYFWDYNRRTKLTDGAFKFCIGSENKLRRDFFPLPHQPSLAKDFYSSNLQDYLKFVKSKI